MAAIIRAVVEKLGGSEAATYVGNTGDMFTIQHPQVSEFQMVLPRAVFL